jgi:serine/threonine protein kinase
MRSRRVKQYEILSKVGSGGMATVYRAREIHTGHIVALKLMHPHPVAADSPHQNPYQHNGKPRHYSACVASLLMARRR